MSSPRAGLYGAVLAFWVALLAVPRASADDPKPGDRERLQGRWQAVEMTSRGRQAPEASVERFHIHIKGDLIVFTSRGRHRQSTFVIDPSSKPRAIDMTPSHAQPRGPISQSGIYELEGDTLKLCLVSTRGKVRPTAFTSTSEDGQTLIVLKRVKQ